MIIILPTIFHANPIPISWNKNYKMKKKQILDLEIDLHETYMKLGCNLH
jgi:hypothetical protein